jgi:hypothetical protein
MADGKLSEFDAKAREVVLLLRAGVQKVYEADGQVRGLLELAGEDEDDTSALTKAMGDALDKIEEGMTEALGALTLTVGRRHVADLVLDELTAHQAADGPADGPADIRERPGF